MTVPVFELPGTTSNMYFVHVNLMNSVENTKIQKSGPLVEPLKPLETFNLIAIL